MEYKELSESKMPVLGFGTWQLDDSTAKEKVLVALKNGYRHIDTAEMYGNEEGIGKALEKAYDQDLVKREDLFITSKVWRSNLKYEDVISACETTLKKLKTNYLDLYLVHWPNHEVAIRETLTALKALKVQGKIRNIGVSNFTVELLKEALGQAKELGITITCNQVEFHPGLYQKELIEFCKDNGVVLTAYSPIGQGQILSDEKVKKVAEKHNKTPAQIALRWNIDKGAVAIPRSQSDEHIKENLDVFSFKLDDEDHKLLDSLKSGRIVSPGFAPF